MNKLYTLTLLFLLSAFHVTAQFITLWRTDNLGNSQNNQIIIPATGTGYSIAWQEIGNPANNGIETGSGTYTLTFPSVGTYQVSISPGSGTFTRIRFDTENDRRKLLEVRQWGNIQWENMEKAFAGCNNMIVTATDIPNLQSVTSMAAMFDNCHAITTIPGINSWDVSTVTNMALMFYGTVWNEPIDNWNVSNVTDMSGMFSDANFNQPLGSWNVGRVTNMAFMFASTPNFNQPIGSWDVSSVTDMTGMFSNARSFNQPLNDWDVGQVTNMNATFSNAIAFNSAIDGWDVGNVENMSQMFVRATSFNQPLSSWNPGKVTDMSVMFGGASSFNQPIGSWNVASVTNMFAMFREASAFNQSINDWDLSSVTDMSYMFTGALAFNQPVNDWDLSQVANLTGLFLQAPSFNQPVNNWNVSNVTSMAGVFAFCPSFNQSLSKWTVASATDLSFLLTGTAMDCVNMTYTLRGWAENPATPDNVVLGADGLSYGLQAAAALETLTATKGWTITIGEAVVCGALEVSLVSFDAKNAGGTVKLEWATASETDNDYFEVERSANTRSWNVIGKIKGAGTVNSVRNYALTDPSPLEGVSYYRLKIVDFAGKADYSDIRAVKVTGQAPSIYPNPATISLTLSGKTDGYIKIYNSSGRQVGQMEVRTEKTAIPLKGLPAGSYVIKSEDGWNSKFVKE